MNNNAVTVPVLFVFWEVNRKPNLKLVVFYNSFQTPSVNLAELPERRFFFLNCLLNALTVVQQH